MFVETVPCEIGRLPIPDTQKRLLTDHLQNAREFIYPAYPTPEESLAWLQQSLNLYLPQNEANTLFAVAQQNPRDKIWNYQSEGYDNCQPHRLLAKTVGEAILLGGLQYEAELLGLNLDARTAKELISSILNTTDKQDEHLITIAAAHGGKQDFLFPGIASIVQDPPQLETLAVNTLKGTPLVIKRNLTGVGGIRFDKLFNKAMDLPSLIDMKIFDDRRYSPGIAIFLLLRIMEPNQIPAVTQMRLEYPEIYTELSKLIVKIKETSQREETDISILNSNYLPSWDELRYYQGMTVESPLDIEKSLHSPSYECVVLHDLFKDFQQEATIDQSSTVANLRILKKSLSHLWSFNPPNHLPYTKKYSYLAAGLTGIITNHQGDYAVRFGIGHKGRSVEIRQYNFGSTRTVPSLTLAGKKAYELLYYPESELFDGIHDSMVFLPDNPLWTDIQERGFIASGIDYLANSSVAGVDNDKVLL